MIFGVLKDIKPGEFRVICTPMEVAAIVAAGHTVYVQKDAGKAAGFADDIGVFENAGVARVQEVITNSISIFPHNCLLDWAELSLTDKLSFYWLPARLNTFAPMSRATGASF